MNPVIERKFGSVQSQWKLLKLGRYSGVLGSVLCLVWFLLLWLIWRGVLTSRDWAICLVIFFVLGVVLSFIGLFFYVMSRRSKRTWMAGVVEKSVPGLMDRVNTLVFLEDQKPSSQRSAIASKIQQQAAKIISSEEPVFSLSPEKTFVHLGIFLCLLVAVIYFQVHFDPFAKLQKTAALKEPAKADSLFELKAGNAVEKAEKKTWGEIRIIEPGHDLKMTKVDVVPLQIEMAASDAMTSPAWVTSINGGDETRHELAAPSEPNYAVYQPLIYLDELKVSDWDVVSYYGRVESCAPAEYTSKIYFIEIRPFRDDILKMTGGDGKGNKAYAMLNEISGLIKQQTELLQQTHLYQKTNYSKEELKVQDRKKLAGSEGDLHGAADQLYGKIASESENTAIGDILDHLAQAGQHMDKSAEALTDDAVPEGKQREQKALAELIATRKSIQKTISENPDAFGSDGGDDDKDNDPTVDDSRKALKQVSEMKDRAQAALDSMQQLTKQQQVLADMARARLKQDNGGPLTAKAQSDLKERLDHLIKENPDLFRATENEQAAVKENMEQAIENLKESSEYGSHRYMTRSAETMRDLQKVVEKNHQLQQLAEAYELKKIIDQNVQQLSKEEGKPGSLSSEEAKALAESAKNSTGALKEISDSGAGSGMGPDLGKALSQENQEALQQALDKFSQAQSKEERQASAGEAGKGLAKVSQAFEQSQPGSTKQARGQDNLQGQGGDSLGQAEQQLESMMMAKEQGHPFSPEIESKALNDILRHLKMSMVESQEANAEKATMVAKVEAMVNKKGGLPVDPVELKKLVDEIEAVRIEIKDQPLDKEIEATTQVDPSKFPPSYRERIKRYFEQLSTTPP